MANVLWHWKQKMCIFIYDVYVREKLNVTLVGQMVNER